MEVKELKITVPWGFVAAKTWGDDSNPLVLMVHGLFDNAGSFDRLMPYLPRTFFYVCIDLPGHGKSSHYPPHLPLHNMIYGIVTYKYIVDHLHRDTLIIIGHSWGGQLATFFTQLYPKYVSKLILLDALTFYPVSVEYAKQYLTGRIANAIEVNRKLASRAPPSYTYEEALNRQMKERIYGGLTKKAAEALLKRALIPLENGKFRFSNDVRLRGTLAFMYGEGLPDRLIERSPIKCPVLMIFASDSIPMLEYMKSFVKEMRKRNRNCVIRTVNGNHDVHNNEPLVVAPLINDFLNKYSSKL